MLLDIICRRNEAQDALQHKDFDRAARLFERSLQDVPDLVTMALPARVLPKRGNGVKPESSNASGGAKEQGPHAHDADAKDIAEKSKKMVSASKSAKKSAKSVKKTASSAHDNKQLSDSDKDADAAREALAHRAAQTRFVIPEYVETTDSASVVNARPQRAPDFAKIQYMFNRHPQLAELKMRYQLVTARLAGDNTENMLRKAVREITELTLFMPQENSVRPHKFSMFLFAFAWQLSVRGSATFVTKSLTHPKYY